MFGNKFSNGKDSGDETKVDKSKDEKKVAAATQVSLKQKERCS